MENHLSLFLNNTQGNLKIGQLCGDYGIVPRLGLALLHH